VIARLLLLLATLAALYDSKILVWDIAVADLRAGSGGWPTVIFAVVVSLGFVLLPLYLGLRARSKKVAILIAVGSLLLSALGFVVLSAAFTP
jgi:hypothetical protein